MSENGTQVPIIKTEEQKRAEVRTIITIGVNGMSELVVHAPFANPVLCLNALADAVKIVAEHCPKAEETVVK